jgi:hypothetical protein
MMTVTIDDIFTQLCELVFFYLRKVKLRRGEGWWKEREGGKREGRKKYGC